MARENLVCETSGMPDSSPRGTSLADTKEQLIWWDISDQSHQGKVSQLKTYISFKRYNLWVEGFSKSSRRGAVISKASFITKVGREATNSIAIVACLTRNLLVNVMSFNEGPSGLVSVTK